MNVEKQVCSLEISKKLKKLGVDQKSIFVWEYHDDKCYGVKFIPYAVMPNQFNKYELFSAFTVAELGNMLPDNSCSQKICMSNEYVCRIYNDDDTRVDFIAETEADARAKMLIYLLENNLYKLPG